MYDSLWHRGNYKSNNYSSRTAVQSVEWCCLASGSQAYTICHSPSLCVSCVITVFIFFLLFVCVCSPTAVLQHLNLYRSSFCAFIFLSLFFLMIFLFVSFLPPCQETLLCYMHPPSVSCTLLSASSVSEQKQSVNILCAWIWAIKCFYFCFCFFTLLVWVMICSSAADN